MKKNVAGKFYLKTCLFIIVTLFILFNFSDLSAQTIRGIVFDDANLNGEYNSGEKGIPDVGISNGEDIVLTDETGRYSIELNDQKIVFLIKPSEYNTFVGEKTNKPFFYYNINESEGMGNVVSGKDFPLIKTEVRNNFSAIVLGDIQVTNDEEINYLRDITIAELINEKASFVLTLGDNANDNLEVYPRLTEVMGKIGKPVYYLPGNHDTNDNLEGPSSHYNIYKNYFGPQYYSFNYGKVHFIILNNVKWESGAYHGELGEKQLNWIKEDLKYVPKENLIVISMHIPLISWVDKDSPRHHVKDRQELFNLLDGFDNVLTLAGHTHTLERLYPNDVLDGWDNGLQYPHIIAGAVCGSWWNGEKDELGVPFSYMRDGAPKGYFIFNFSDNTYEDSYKTTGKPKDYQMHISLLNGSEYDSDNIINKNEINNMKVVANVFNGDKDSEVSISYDNNNYLPMERDPIIDPLLDERLLGNTEASQSTHTWTYNLPESLSEGVHTVNVKFVDRYGNEYRATKIFEVK
ncbi:MAG: calcineurin-like phosphoesterase family protein, partial [Deferribacterota bacterium]|nr:calcineurin-like phosphoesterase family protein [Deferribacterota bacterium]